MYYLIKSDGLAVYEDTSIPYRFKLVKDLIAFREGIQWTQSWILSNENQLNAWCIFRSENIDEVVEHAVFEVI